MNGVGKSLLGLVVGIACFEVHATGEAGSLPDHLGDLSPEALAIEQISESHNMLVEAWYQKITKTVRPKISTFLDEYIAGLNAALKEAQANGDLERMLAFKNEIESVEKEGGIKPLEKGSNQNGAEADLILRQKQYFQQIASLRAESSTVEKQLLEQFVKALLRIKTEQTKAGNLDQGITAHNLAALMLAHQKKAPDSWIPSGLEQTKTKPIKGLEEIKSLFPMSFAPTNKGKKLLFSEINKVLQAETIGELILFELTKDSQIDVVGLFGNDSGWKSKPEKLEIGGIAVNSNVLVLFDKESELRLLGDDAKALVVGRIANCYLNESDGGSLVVDIVNAVPTKDGTFDPSAIAQAPELKIFSAKFGTGNKWMDVKSVIEEKLVQDRGSVWTNTRSMGGDPSPGWNKGLRIHYSLGGEEKRISRGKNGQVKWTDLYIIPPPDSPETTPIATPIDLTLRQTKINALLVIDSGSGKGHAGLVSGFTATAFAEEGNETSEVGFNQDVGEMMSSAMKEAVKYVSFVHNGWPKGYRIEFGFDEKYSGKDGPSAAVACALLLDSMVTGDKINSQFAVTGDMNVDGSVQPIGGIRAKIRGATNGNCTVVAVPKKNEESISDLFILDGPEPFVKIQIFSIADFKEAKRLASATRVGFEKTAIDTFAEVRTVLLRDPQRMHVLLRNPHVIAKLKEVLEKTPNHLSAKYLHKYAIGNAPEQLSVFGSFLSIENGGQLLIDSIKANNARNTVSSLKPDEMGKSISLLKNNRNKLDPRLREYSDSLVDFGLLVRDAQDITLNSEKKVNDLIKAINQSIDNINNQRSRLLKDPEIIEEIEG